MMRTKCLKILGFFSRAHLLFGSSAKNVGRHFFVSTNIISFQAVLSLCVILLGKLCGKLTVFDDVVRIIVVNTCKAGLVAAEFCSIAPIAAGPELICKCKMEMIHSVAAASGFTNRFSSIYAYFPPSFLLP